MRTIIDRMERAIQNWWLSLLLGILYIIVAISLMFSPLSSYVAISILFSVSIFVSGIFEIMFAVSNRKGLSTWGWYLAAGAIDIILGTYLMAYPIVSMEVIPFVVAFWLMFRGFTFTGYAMDLKHFGSREWGWYMVFGILAILCALAVIWQPRVGVFSAIYMLAFTFLIVGILRIMLSFELKNIHKKNKEIMS